MSLIDGTIKPLEIKLRSIGEVSTQVKLVENFNHGIIISIGNDARAVVMAQDLLNAARMMGAKDIDVRIK